MPSFFLSFNVLSRQPQLKGWSNRPEVPLASRWRKKNVRPSSPTAAPPSSSSKLTASAAAATTTARASIHVTKPSPSPGRSTTTSNSSSKWKGGATTNVLLIHPICRCCTDVVNCITRPYKRRASNSRASMQTTTPSSRTLAARSCSGTKTTWDGLPSTQYMRLWPQPDHEKLREAKFMTSSSSPSRFAAASSSPGPHSALAGEKKSTTDKNSKKQKRRSIWKFWPSIF